MAANMPPPNYETAEMYSLDILEAETGQPAVATVIWLHGLGADAHDFEPVVPLLGLGPERPLRFVFPNAPTRPVTINGGMVMRAWYDIFGFDATSREDEAGVRAISEDITALIHAEVERGVAAEQVFLAGFSQGGAMALFSGLRYPFKLGGLLALSCYLPAGDSLAAEMSEENRGTPIFMAHGSQDPVVSPKLGEISREKLLAENCDLRWHSYDMDHTVTPEELMDIRQFLDALVKMPSAD